MLKNVMEFFIKKCGYFSMENNVLWMKTKKDMLKGLPKFYEEVKLWLGQNLLSLNKNKTEVIVSGPSDNS